MLSLIQLKVILGDNVNINIKITNFSKPDIQIAKNNCTEFSIEEIGDVEEMILGVDSQVWNIENINIFLRNSILWQND